MNSLRLGPRPGVRVILMAIVAAIAVLNIVHRVAAQTVVFDSFSSAAGASFTSHAPNVNLPGGAYGFQRNQRRQPIDA